MWNKSAVHNHPPIIGRTIAQFKVIDEYKDVLQCTPWDDSYGIDNADGLDDPVDFIYVAKAYKYRNSVITGVQTSYYVGGDNPEDGDVIFAVLLGTPIFVDMTDVNDGTTGYTKLTPCTWQDLCLTNSDGPGLYYVQLIQQNYLICNFMQDGSGATVYVAKPPLLRATAIWTPPRSVAGQGYTITYSDYSADGQTRVATRTAYGSFAAATENQGVDDDYQQGDPIFAFPINTGLTTPVGVPVNLQDMNVDGRHWAKLAVS